MSVNTELQNLLTKMRGSPSEEDSNSNLIKKISDAYDGSGSGGGSCDCRLITHLVSSEGLAALYLDKTAGEIYQAAMDGKMIMFIHDDENTGYGWWTPFTMIEYASTSEGDTYHFVTATGDSFTASSADEYPQSSDGPK